MGTVGWGLALAMGCAGVLAACSGSPSAPASTAARSASPVAPASSPPVAPSSPPLAPDAGTDVRTAIAIVADAGAGGVAFLGQVEVTSGFGDDLSSHLARDRSVALTLRVARGGGEGLPEIERRTKAKPRADGSLVFEYARYPPSRDRVADTYRRPSFLVDFDEPSVQAVRAQAQSALDAGASDPPAMDALARFVSGFIEKKNLQRDFDVASRVASRKEGDCTEHAVLLAALGRSFGYPTRVVLGAVILVVERRVLAFEHAWVEYALGGSWRLADAAIAPDVGARYLPLQVLRDEGPGFARSLLESGGMSALRAIEIGGAR